MDGLVIMDCQMLYMYYLSSTFLSDSHKTLIRQANMNITMCIVLIFLFKKNVICDVKMILWWKKHVCINYVWHIQKYISVNVPYHHNNSTQ